MALIRRIGLSRFDRWGSFIGRIDYSAAKHTEALDGTDELEVTCTDDLTKGERIVWCDRRGIAHEHIVDEVTRKHDSDGDTYTEATCINSINETWDDYVEDKRPSGGVSEALTSILSGTRWAVGTCTQTGTASKTFYHESVREAITDLLDTWGGEMETAISTDGVKVTGRSVAVLSLRGNQSSAKRFTWTKDLLSIERKVESENPKTRIYGYGKGVETDSGGYGRRLTFADINSGKAYVEDAAATKVWGHPDSSGNVVPAVGTYVNEQCEDASQLLAETKAYLDKAKEPTVSYTASVLDLYAFGRDWEGVGIGDSVAIIDKEFSEDGIRLKGRVSQLVSDLVTAESTVTFGNLTDSMADMFAAISSTLRSSSNSRSAYDAVTSTSAGWLKQLQSALNDEFNSVGTYKVETFELGTIWSNVALDTETGMPLKTTSGMWAININGRGIRLASSLTSAGAWSWTTFITGSSVTADCINTGTMTANRVRTGLLTDSVGRNYWNLTSGDFKTTKGTIGGFTIDYYSISNSTLSLKSDGMHFIYSSTDIGTIGTNHYTGDSSKYGLTFDLNSSGAYMTWASKTSSSDTSYMMKWTYANKTIGNYGSGKLHAGCNIDMHNYKLDNLGGGITQTIHYVQVLSMNSDGTAALWGPNGMMEFTNGLLTNLTYYKN